MVITVDEIDRMMFRFPEYQNLGFDQRGELCVKLSELLDKYFGEELDVHFREELFQEIIGE